MSKGNVVVIDDSHIMRKLAMIALSEEGYKVYTAENGEEGLELAEKVSPSVIVVDFIMPRMNGYQFCKMLKDSEKLKDIPVILVTGKGEDTGIQFRKKFGICSYLVKPFEPIELVDMVNASAQQRQAETIASPEDVYSAPEPEEVAEPVPSYLEVEEKMPPQTITEPEPVYSHVPEIEKVIESAIRNYFHKEFPSVLQNNIASILKQSPAMKISDIILSGELSYFNIFDIFQLVDVEKLTGCLYVYSPAVSYEVYFDKGYVVLATTSSEGKNILSRDVLDKKGISKEEYNRVVNLSKERGITLLEVFVSEGILSEEAITAILREHMGNVICDIIDVDAGKFFMEKAPLPDYIMNMPIRLKASQFIFEAVKKVAKKRHAI
ncbi:MAG: response regulator [Thermodesulfovibrionales bacterium]|nr:response regulator [Thermodesulfovibrionales bacterium]